MGITITTSSLPGMLLEDVNHHPKKKPAKGRKARAGAKKPDGVTPDHALENVDDHPVETPTKGRKFRGGTNKTDGVLTGRVKKTKAEAKIAAAEVKDVKGIAAEILKVKQEVEKAGHYAVDMEEDDDRATSGADDMEDQYQDI